MDLEVSLLVGVVLMAISLYYTVEVHRKRVIDLRLEIAATVAGLLATTILLLGVAPEILKLLHKTSLIQNLNL